MNTPSSTDRHRHAALQRHRRGRWPTTRWTTSPRLVSSRSSTAAPGVEPADLEQVGEQVLEPVELGLQQLGGTRGHRVEARPRVVQHVAGHPHRGQRRAQLVGDVGDERALHAGELHQLADLGLQRLGHLVERHRQPGDVVLARDVHPLLEPSGGDPLGDATGQPHRRDHLTGHQRGDSGDEQQQQHAGGEQHPTQQQQRLLLLPHREQVVERVGAAVGGQHHGRADGHAGLVGALRGRVVAGVADPGVGPGERRPRRPRRSCAGWSARWRCRPPGVVRTPPVVPPSPTGPSTTTSKPLTSPRATRFSTSSRSWVSGSKSLPPADPSRSRAVAVSVRASATEASTRLFTRPSVIWRITIQPTEPTTSAQSTTMAVTTRVRSDRRQRCSTLPARHATSAQTPGQRGQSPAGSSAVPAL